MTELQQLSEQDARNLTNHIKDALSVAWHRIAEAYQRRAWEALGYTTWDEYCTTEFNGSRLRIPREERQEVVGSLREAGLSVRAIASATGNSDQTVQRDLNTGVVNHYTSQTTGLDGKTYTARQDDEPIEAEIVEDEPADPPISGDQLAELKPQPAAKAEKQERTDVVRAMNQVLVNAEEAADHAEKITRNHLARRSEESAVWSRRLTAALATLHQLNTTMQETAQ